MTKITLNSLNPQMPLFPEQSGPFELEYILIDTATETALFVGDWDAWLEQARSYSEAGYRLRCDTRVKDTALHPHKSMVH